MKLIDTGFRLPPPPGCPRSIYEMMIQCWYVYIHWFTLFHKLFLGIQKQMVVLHLLTLSQGLVL